ncbi:hypothetical protein DFJ77DRAFT_510184 [Powellomyces hirtus]|nr:hypothetical protein DFJ77DRAFT_510184 [Powellomyces hirtus]
MAALLNETLTKGGSSKPSMPSPRHHRQAQHLPPSKYCAGTLHAPRVSQSRVTWICKKLKEGMEVDRKTSTKAFQDFIRHRYGSTISYSSGLKAGDTLLAESADDQRDLSQHFRLYCRRLIEADPSTTAIMDVHVTGIPNTTGGLGIPEHQQRFCRVFICTGSAKTASKHCRPFLATDGTFTKNRFVQVS